MSTNSYGRLSLALSAIRTKLPSLKNLRVVLASGATVTVALWFVRLLGLLQPLELWALDQLFWLKPAGLPDDRLLIVEVTAQDLERWGDELRTHSASLPDTAIEQLLSSLELYEPRVIGLDIYRPFETLPSNAYLAERLSNDPNLIVACKRPDDSVNIEGIEPPTEVMNTPDRIGFTDFVEEPGRVVRRYLFHFESDDASTSACNTPYAFSFRVALSYLNAEAVKTPEGDIAVNDVVFKSLERFAGGYQGIDAGGHQILLDYRAPLDDRTARRSPHNIAQAIPMQEVIDGNIKNIDKLKDRIILIGVTDPTSTDIWETPLDSKVPGVMVQAQMVSQVLRAVEDHEPLIWTLSNIGEVFWYFSWGVGGGLLYITVLKLRNGQIFSSIALAIGVPVVAIAVVTGITFAATNGWLPSIPAIFSVSATVCMVGYRSRPQSIEIFFKDDINTLALLEAFEEWKKSVKEQTGEEVFIQKYQGNSSGSSITLTKPPKLENNAAMVFRQQYEALRQRYEDPNNSIAHGSNQHKQLFPKLETPAAKIFDDQSGRVVYVTNNFNINNSRNIQTDNYVEAQNYIAHVEGGEINIDQPLPQIDFQIQQVLKQKQQSSGKLSEEAAEDELVNELAAKAKANPVFKKKLQNLILEQVKTNPNFRQKLIQQSNALAEKFRSITLEKAVEKTAELLSDAIVSPKTWAVLAKLATALIL